MLWVEGQISSYNSDYQTDLKMYGNSAGTYQFFSSEDLIVYGIYVHTGIQEQEIDLRRWRRDEPSRGHAFRS